jgi:hypothetical protein
MKHFSPLEIALLTYVDGEQRRLIEESNIYRGARIQEERKQLSYLRAN